MQTLYYNTDRYMRHTGNVVDLNEYRRKMAAVQRPAAVGLPPRPRRARRCPWGMRLTDLVSMSMVMSTLVVTGLLVTVI